MISPSIIFFDAVWTLIRPEPGVGAAYAKVAADHGHRVDAAALDAAFGRAWKQARGNDPLPYGRTDAEARAFWSRLLRETFREAGHPHVPTDLIFDAVYRRFGTREFWAVYDDVAPALDILHRAGIRAGVLSNFDGRLHGVLSSLGLADDFTLIIASSEAGADKPSPSVYEYAQRAAGILDPASVAHIGDEVEADGAGPLRAGWRCCLIDRHDRHTGSDLPRASSLVDAVQRLLA